MINNQKIAEHYAHAVEKHPHFCDVLAPEWWTRDAKEHLMTHRAILNIQEERNRTDATQILHTEICEIIDAYARKDYDSAVEECYDAIAVLLRMVEFIGKEAAK